MIRRSKVASNFVRPVSIETLEGRRLLCGTVAADVLDPTGGDSSASRVESSAPMAADAVKATAPLTTLAVTQPVKIKGSYVGHYNGAKFGKGTMSFSITKYTHTGHFSGTYTINNSGEDFSGTAKGVVQANKHVHVTLSQGVVTGDFTGTASRTGGSFYGSYQVVAGNQSDHGTYHVGKI